MKLKKSKNSGSDYDYMKCCRWCRYFHSGKCYNKNILSDESFFNKIYEVSESGRLSGVLEETLHSVKLEEFRELELLLREWKISEKRIKEFNKLFRDCYTQWCDFTLKEKLDEDILVCYNNFNNENKDCEGITINNPEDFWCKEWC